jgi:Polysaccharide biosynthesis protein
LDLENHDWELHHSKIKTLAGETVLYGLGNMVPRLLNFLLFPIHTKFFRPEEYGVFTYLMSIVALLNIVYSFGMETAYFRFATKPDADERRVFNIAQTVVIGISSSFSLLFILCSSSFAGLLNSKGHETYIVWLTIILFIDNAVSIPFARLRLQNSVCGIQNFQCGHSYWSQFVFPVCHIQPTSGYFVHFYSQPYRQCLLPALLFQKIDNVEACF